MKEDRNKNKRILVLERETIIGGRADNVPFYGSQIAKGAGIGRKKKDHLLLKLMREMGMPIREFESGFTQSPLLVGCNVKSIFNQLKKKHYGAVRRKTFKEFAEPILGSQTYKLFVTCSGYSDYENEDAYDVLHYYGFEDNFTKFTAFGVSWHELIQKLSDFIGKDNILKGRDIIKIGRKDDGYLLTDGSQKQYFTEKVVLATTIDSVRRLLKMDIYKHIHGQSFIRIYGKFSKDSIQRMREAVNGQMVVPGPIYMWKMVFI
jgi:protoporphyrinogen oxidase